MSIIGTAQPRVDGPAKVSGRAIYAADASAPNLAFGVAICSTIARGSIVSIDTTEATMVPGVLTVMTHENCPKLVTPPKPSAFQGQSLIPLQTPKIAYFGQHVGVVVAESFEAATAAAALVKITYVPDNAPLQFTSEKNAKPAAGGTRDQSWGDPAAALAKSPIKIAARYTTPYEHHNPMEPPTTTAIWTGDQLTLCDETQALLGVRSTLAGILNMPADKIAVSSPFVGGSFGSKRVTWPHVYLAAAAAKLTGRPVRLTLTRSQMYTTMGYRPQTVQDLTLGADKKGRLQVLNHAARTTTSRFDDFVEPASAKTGIMYDCPNGAISRTLAQVDLGTPTTMRAPGEATGWFALECAMDELAAAVGIDPLELRLLNYAESDPMTGHPWSSKLLRDCYAQAARRFGWRERNPKPGSMRDGLWTLGWGVASAAYPVNRSPASASVTLPAKGLCTVASGTHEMGGGTYTSMAAIAADTLGLDIGQVTIELGQTSLPPTTVSGGSRTINSVGPAVEAAASQVVEKLTSLAIADPASPLHGAEPGQVVTADGSLRLKGKLSVQDPFRQILARNKLTELTMTAHTAPSPGAAKYSQYAFGAHFCEVRVDALLGKVCVSRYVAAFAAGRIVNPLTARSQLIGAIIGGIGMALQEESVVDPTIGTFVTRNLVDYRIPVHADIPDIDVILVPEEDPVNNPIGTKGCGELGIVGAAAAVANAVYHATGKRLRNLPITPEKILSSS